MKPILKFATFIILTAIVAFASCKKEYRGPSNHTGYPPPPPPPPPQGRTIKARVVEYGTNLPITGATLSICTSPLGNGNCAGNYTSLTTNASGECFFNGDKYRFGGVSKEGYWEYFSPFFSTYFGDDSLLLTEDIHTADSFIVRKIPKTNITIHVNNSITIPDHNVFLFRLGLSYNQWGYYPGGAITLRPGIDTSFQIPIFGNADNLFAVADYFDGGAFTNALFQELVYIAHGSNFILHIIY